MQQYTLAMVKFGLTSYIYHQFYLVRSTIRFLFFSHFDILFSACDWCGMTSVFQINEHTTTLTLHGQWEDEMLRERTGHLPSYAEDKKMKSITLHTYD